MCPARLTFLRSFAHRTGLPLPAYATFVSQPIASSHVDNRSFAAVGAGSVPKNRDPPLPQEQARSRTVNSPNQPQLQPSTAARENSWNGGAQAPSRKSGDHFAPQQRPGPHVAQRRDEPATSIEQLVRDSQRETQALRKQTKSLESVLHTVLSSLLECISLFSKSKTPVNTPLQQRQDAASVNTAYPLRSGNESQEMSTPEREECKSSDPRGATEQMQTNPRDESPQSTSRREHRDKEGGGSIEIIAERIRDALSLLASNLSGNG